MSKDETVKKKKKSKHTRSALDKKLEEAALNIRFEYLPEPALTAQGPFKFQLQAHPRPWVFMGVKDYSDAVAIMVTEAKKQGLGGDVFLVPLLAGEGV